MNFIPFLWGSVCSDQHQVTKQKKKQTPTTKTPPHTHTHTHTNTHPKENENQMLTFTDIRKLLKNCWVFHSGRVRHVL